MFEIDLNEKRKKNYCHYPIKEKDGKRKMEKERKNFN